MQSLSLRDTRVTDAGLKELTELTLLQELSLRGTKVTDSTLQVVNTLTTLESLDIGFAQVTDSGLLQSPLNSPTVFNFFMPDFRFPGALASAGLTTPEFQLTSDTTVALQMNFMERGLLVNGNTNGLSSFNNGNGAIALDLGPWMTPAYTSNAGIPNLVDALSSLLMGGQLSTAARNAIITSSPARLQ